jgi:RNA polymerase sigma-70 factor (ECF subfamily)
MGAGKPMLGMDEQWAVSERRGERAAESALIRAGLAGDRAALEQLLGPHKRSLVALCYGILGNAEDAEDAAQETLLRALRALSSFRGDAPFRAWLFRIAVNTCCSWKRYRHPTELWDEEGACAPGTASPEVIALSHLRLREALHSLPERQRAVLLLKEWEGFSMAEIAVTMGWNETRAKNELYKARRALIDWQRREAAEGGTP